MLPESTHSERTIVNVDGLTGARTLAHHRRQQGAAKGAKLKVVCKKCNETWMSRLEEQVRPTLTPMIAGDSITISPDEQRVLAEWITLKLMVAEWSDRENAAMSDAERRAFYESREVPAGLQVALYRCGEGMMRTWYHRNSLTMNSKPELPATGTRKNLKSVTLGIGELLIYALYVGSPEIGIDLNSESPLSIPLVPCGEAAIHWPPNRRLTAPDAIFLANTLNRLSQGPRTKWIAT